MVFWWALSSRVKERAMTKRHTQFLQSEGALRGFKRLKKRDDMFTEAIGLIQKAEESIVDTTWVSSNLLPPDIERIFRKPKRVAYEKAKDKVCEWTPYREIISLYNPQSAPHSAILDKAIKRHARALKTAHEPTPYRYDFQYSPSNTEAPFFPCDFLVVDGKHVVLSNCQDPGSEMCYIKNCPALGSVLVAVFDYHWYKMARAPHVTTKIGLRDYLKSIGLSSIRISKIQHIIDDSSSNNDRVGAIIDAIRVALVAIDKMSRFAEVVHTIFGYAIENGK